MALKAMLDQRLDCLMVFARPIRYNHIIRLDIGQRLGQVRMVRRKINGAAAYYGYLTTQFS